MGGGGESNPGYKKSYFFLYFCSQTHPPSHSLTDSIIVNELVAGGQTLVALLVDRWHCLLLFIKVRGRFFFAGMPASQMNWVGLLVMR